MFNRPRGPNFELELRATSESRSGSHRRYCCEFSRRDVRNYAQEKTSRNPIFTSLAQILNGMCIASPKRTRWAPSPSTFIVFPFPSERS